MTARALVAIAAGGSAALLLGALAFQYLGGLAPCTLCYWQRWPHLAAALIGGGGLVLGLRLIRVAIAGAIAAVTTAGFGLYHVGVERKWWEGPQGCTGFDISNLSSEELMEAITSAPLVRCDEVVWSLAGLSMAGWNAVLSLVLAFLWAIAARKAVRPG